jgi:hypothetical protein
MTSDNEACVPTPTVWFQNLAETDQLLQSLTQLVVRNTEPTDCAKGHRIWSNGYLDKIDTYRAPGRSIPFARLERPVLRQTPLTLLDRADIDQNQNPNEQTAPSDVRDPRARADAATRVRKQAMPCPRCVPEAARSHRHSRRNPRQPGVFPFNQHHLEISAVKAAG